MESHPFTLWQTNSFLLKMAIEIVDLRIKHGDFPVRYLNVCQRVTPIKSHSITIKRP